jgi:hypothetical protein
MKNIDEDTFISKFIENVYLVAIKLKFLMDHEHELDAYRIKVRVSIWLLENETYGVSFVTNIHS